MTVLTAVLVIASALAVPNGTIDWDEARAQLEALAENESAFVDAVRAYTNSQQDLIAWDLSTAEEYRISGKDETLINAALARAQLRAETIQKAYEFALEYYPNSGRVNTYYGEILYDLKGDQIEALRRWKLAAAMDKKLSAPRNNMAIHYCHTGDVATGLRYFDQALKLEPDNADYQYNLAQIYLTYSLDIKREREWDGKRLYREAMKLSQRSARTALREYQAAVDERGAAPALARRNYELIKDYAVNFYAAENLGAKANWQDAAEAWRDARSCAPTHNDVFFAWLNEGRAWLRHNANAKAAVCFKEAIAMKPESEVAKRLLVKATGTPA